MTRPTSGQRISYNGKRQLAKDIGRLKRAVISLNRAAVNGKGDATAAVQKVAEALDGCAWALHEIAAALDALDTVR